MDFSNLEWRILAKKAQPIGLSKIMPRKMIVISGVCHRIEIDNSQYKFDRIGGEVVISNRLFGKSTGTPSTTENERVNCISDCVRRIIAGLKRFSLSNWLNRFDFHQILIYRTQVHADDAATPAATTTPPQPSRKISVQQYRPRATDFLTNIDEVPIKSFTMRKSEPSICTRMRAFLDSTFKTVYEMIENDVRRISNALAASKSPNIDKASTDAKNAIQKVYAQMADISNSSLAAINGNCSWLNTTGVLNLTMQGLEDWRRAQIDNAVKLAQIPDSYEAKMQNNYLTIEKVIGTNF